MAASTNTVSFFLTMAAVVAMAVLQAAAASPPPPPPIPYQSPTSCASTLLQLFDCAPFLALGVISGPPANCCASLRDVLGTPASICLCHVIDGQINTYLGINIDPIRLALLPVACWAIVPPELPAMCFFGPVPPISTIPVPPVTPPSPIPPTPPVTPPSPPMRPLP